MAVLKPDKKSVRICGDFRTTVNPVSKLHRYPIPRVEDLFAGLEKGKTFSTIDLKQDPASQKYLVINTHRGLFKYTLLPYGVSSAPGIFQQAMEQLLRGLPGVVVYIDDILVAGSTEKEHLQALEEVLKRLANARLRAKQHKCHVLHATTSNLPRTRDRCDWVTPNSEQGQSHSRCAPTAKRNRAQIVSRFANVTTGSFCRICRVI